MKIERAVLREVPLPLKQPFGSSAGVVAERRSLLLRLEAEGLVAWSECVAFSTPHYTAETTDTAWRVLTEELLPAAVGSVVGAPDHVAATGSESYGHPMAKATLEMATWDLRARASGQSLQETLGGRGETVEVGVALGVMDIDALAAAVEEQLSHGYRRVKVKIEPGHDVEVVSALRRRFPAVALWADANGAYSSADPAHLQALDGLGLGLLEEPLRGGDFRAVADLQARWSTPICLDESIETEAQLGAAIELASCRVVNLKPGRVGGLATCLRMLDTLTAAGLHAWCGGMLETGIGRAYNLALASLPGFTLPGDISASRRYWERDIVSPEHDVVDGRMAVPQGPGIGVEVDEERIEALTDRAAEFA